MTLFAKIKPSLRARFSELRSTLQSERGLTLVEIIIVLIILALVMSFLTKNLFKASNQAKSQLSEQMLQRLKEPLLMYQLKNNTLPPDISNAGVDESDMKDSFGNKIQYRMLDGGRAYELKSLGADGKDGGSGADADIIVKGP
jgi:general secretion pathway protein G